MENKFFKFDNPKDFSDAVQLSIDIDDFVGYQRIENAFDDKITISKDEFNKFASMTHKLHELMKKMETESTFPKEKQCYKVTIDAVNEDFGYEEKVNVLVELESGYFPFAVNQQIAMLFKEDYGINLDDFHWTWEEYDTLIDELPLASFMSKYYDNHITCHKALEKLTDMTYLAERGWKPVFREGYGDGVYDGYSKVAVFDEDGLPDYHSFSLHKYNSKHWKDCSGDGWDKIYNGDNGNDATDNEDEDVYELLPF